MDSATSTGVMSGARTIVPGSEQTFAATIIRALATLITVLVTCTETPKYLCRAGVRVSGLH